MIYFILYINKVKMENITKPTFFKYEDFNVYPAEEVLNYDPVFFKNHKITSKNIRDSIEIFNLIENNHFILLAKKKESWFKYERKYPKAKLFLTKEWVENNIPKFKDISNDDDYECPPTPDILELTDNEKFKDTDGNVLDIEVRGTRNKKDTYFKVKNVSKEFNMPNLQIVLIDKKKCYDENIHYRYFSTYQKQTYGLKVASKKEIFLTYKGMLKVLFSSRSGNAEKFTDWVEDVIHTHHIGSINSKQKLASTLLGVDIDTIKKVLSSKSGKIPCIYLFFVGFAKDIIKDNEISYTDDDIICKFGRTDDLHRRSGEHFNTYNELYKSKIELLTFSIIDPANEKESEKAVKTCLSDYRIKIDNQKELIMIKKNKLKDIRYQYELIQNKFIGAQAGLEKHIEELKRIIKEKEHDIELKNKDIENVKLNCKLDLKEKDLFIKNLELEIMMLKNKLLLNNIKID